MENNENKLMSDPRLHTNKMGNNLFDNSQVINNINLLKNKSKDRTLLSKNPEKTGIAQASFEIALRQLI
jgi:hypothetical protein